MGMYTQLHMGVRLKPDTPEDIIKLIKYILNEGEEPNKLPDHPLFKSEMRWNYMLQCDSYYFDYKTTSRFEYDKIGNHWWFNVTCNFKNYNNELKHFLNWIKQYLENDNPEEMIGYSRYEEALDPTIITYESIE